MVVQWAAKVAEDDFITFKVSGCFGRRLCVRVLRVQRFPSFEAMLTTCGVDNVLPGIESVRHGVREYHKMASRQGEAYADLEASHGVVAIYVHCLKSSA